MYIELKITKTKNLKTRSYVSFYYNSKRYRMYNAGQLGLEISPNSASSIKLRNEALVKLKDEIQKAFNNGWTPEINDKSKKLTPIIAEEKAITLIEALDEIINEKMNSKLSEMYKRDMEALSNHFISFLTDIEKSENPNSLKPQRVLKFLSQFNTSGTTFNNKRRMLSVFFNAMIDKEYLDKSPSRGIKKARATATLHTIYSDQELKRVLQYLKKENDDLYICCLMTFACLLRPHAEIRNLKGSHFQNNFTEIQLSGEENKSGRVRVVHIPDYVRSEIEDRVRYLKHDTNLFSLNSKAYNYGYFNTIWDRLRPEMLRLKIIRDGQTIYSFRHSAAIEIYKNCKDVSIVQQLMGHSNMIVTLTYLRSLGALNTEKYNQYLPTLELI